MISDLKSNLIFVAWSNIVKDHAVIGVSNCYNIGWFTCANTSGAWLTFVYWYRCITYELALLSLILVNWHVVRPTFHLLLFKILHLTLICIELLHNLLLVQIIDHKLPIIWNWEKAPVLLWVSHTSYVVLVRVDCIKRIDLFVIIIGALIIRLWNFPNFDCCIVRTR